MTNTATVRITPEASSWLATISNRTGLTRQAILDRLLRVEYDRVKDYENGTAPLPAITSNANSAVRPSAPVGFDTIPSANWPTAKPVGGR